MTRHGTGGEGTPEEQDGTPFGSDEIWLRFLTDSERAIRRSAPREPSARERAPQGRLRPLEADHVGDLWQPEAVGTGPAWRDLDGRARLRRAGRVTATAAAIALALGAWSLLSTNGGTPSDSPDAGTVQQLEEAPEELPMATDLPPDAAG
ncbi:hypothetical protein [Streptomyces dysideae]|uniref:Uncharacterized protein n=1 Tax=Streptomyces dysideae TaxID=909626 RepID=A0A117RXI2_9ACTN|nr:hypothetical protein [Streptomyces dysideae]KUO14780.1 hypothetical protein AQJ91_45050 [Streptomyces dysideae]